MPINSRKKGTSGELSWVNWLKGMGFAHAHRSQQYKGTADSFDVLVDDCYIPNWEVKRVERLNLHQAMNKSLEESEEKDGVLFGVAHRKNRERWIVSFDAEMFFKEIVPEIRRSHLGRDND